MTVYTTRTIFDVVPEDLVSPGGETQNLPIFSHGRRSEKRMHAHISNVITRIYLAFCSFSFALRKYIVHFQPDFNRMSCNTTAGLYPFFFPSELTHTPPFLSQTLLESSSFQISPLRNPRVPYTPRQCCIPTSLSAESSPASSLLSLETSNMVPP